MVAGTRERETALAARCSNAAREQLDAVRMHPLYPEILIRLEGVKGKLFEIDVERALYEVIKADRARRPFRHAGAR
jgi:hypothetical protein